MGDECCGKKEADMPDRDRPEEREESRPFHSPILVPGRNCWRLESVEKAAFLVDGEAYFQAFRDVALHAKHSIMIVGWDVDTRTELVRGGEEARFPTKLGEFMRALLRRNRRLRMYVLNWDYAMIYALEREWLPPSEPDWGRYPRLFYRVDGQHPLGASHHQKVVVVDDTIAFVGGLDLTKARWDTRAHSYQDVRRVDADGNSYAPFHDVQMMVSGDAAGALGDLARSRWLKATGRRLPQSSRRPVEELWPSACTPDLERCLVGILRTQPAYEGQVEVREIQQSYLDGIKSARKSIYIESQYFTSRTIGRALAARLSEADGPDVVLVLRHNCDGWLERQTMDVLRAKILNDLELADHYGRFRVYAPTVPGTGGAEKIGVHSKVLIVDDEFVCLGSANMSNRSMGFDTECNLAVDAAGQPRLRAAIAAFRNGLLGEHLGVGAEAVAEQIRFAGSLTGAIEALRGGDRSLEDGCFDYSDAAAAMVPEALLVDPERPMGADEIIGSMVHQKEREYVSRRLLIGVSVLAALGAMAAAWRWTPIGEHMNVESLVETIRAVGQGPMGFLTLLTGYVLGGFFAIPITLLIVVTVIALGAWLGAPFALAGSLLSAVALFTLGRMLGRYRVQQFAGRRVAHLSRRLAERGLWAILMVRVLPVAPFSMVNLVAGATALSLRHFIIGTILGMAPGILVTAALVDRVEEAMRRPSPLALSVLGLLIMAAWAMGWYLSRRLLQWRPPGGSVAGAPTPAAT
jgi:phosphatidylserine/phosphatidylglycerophosphate/cardiolipin synthase-like enzyme/uncharacterized membrane protein YdjX (TVP38/TMEM64 family)